MRTETKEAVDDLVGYFASMVETNTKIRHAMEDVFREEIFDRMSHVKIGTLLKQLRKVLDDADMKGVIANRKEWHQEDGVDELSVVQTVFWAIDEYEDNNIDNLVDLVLGDSNSKNKQMVGMAVKFLVDQGYIEPSGNYYKVVKPYNEDTHLKTPTLLHSDFRF
jgi:hypothetical protein